MRKIKTLLVLLGVCFSFSGCEKTLEIYLGFPLQPKNINAVYQPGLNVFGIVKAGPSFDTVNSFFEVQEIIPIHDTATYFGIDDAIIELTCTRNVEFTYNYNLNPNGNGRYANNFVVAKPADVWDYKCIYDTVLITAQTIVPNYPVIKPNSLSVTNNTISFVLSTDPTAFIYDIYYISSNSFNTKRYVPQKWVDTQVSMSITDNRNSKTNLLYVFAYDKNYEEYVTTSNIFFKPNAYRPRFTTVDGGYGCFCSVSSLMIDLNNAR